MLKLSARTRMAVLGKTTTYGLEHGCHVLNIWRPAGAPVHARLPVMLYVPGGSNDFGEAEPYNASALAAQQGAIITSINYRVGPVGVATRARGRRAVPLSPRAAAVAGRARSLASPRSPRTASRSAPRETSP
jgi:carboxylesterase type B